MFKAKKLLSLFSPIVLLGLMSVFFGCGGGGGTAEITPSPTPTPTPQPTDALDNWHLRTSGTTNPLIGITYGNGTFVAVGYDGIIVTSPDGITWTSRNSATSGALGLDLYGVTYGNGTFVAVGSFTASIGRTAGTILSSPDGVTWTSRNPGTIAGLDGATYGNGTFVAVGAGGTILSSPDGVTWTSRNSGNYSLFGATYGNGTFVAVGYHFNMNDGIDVSYDPILLTSPDGVTWTSRNPGTIAGLNGVTYGNGTFVAVGWRNDVNSGAILTSTDGVTWTSRNSGDYYLDGATYGNGTFVAVGAGGVIIQSDPL